MELAVKEGLRNPPSQNVQTAYAILVLFIGKRVLGQFSGAANIKMA